MLLFNSGGSSITLSDVPPLVPMAIGGITQRKTSATEQAANSQDAFGLFIAEHFMIGVVCDGCGSGHKDSERSKAVSSNEVGARLITHGTLANCAKLLAEPAGLFARKPVPDEAFLGTVTKALIKSLAATVVSFCGKDEALSERFICDNLMSTVLGVLVTKERYLIFGCGDGYFGLNDKVIEMRPSDEGGEYLANTLLPALCPKKFRGQNLRARLQCLASGSIEELHGMFVATDGFAAVHSRDNSFLADVIRSTPTPAQVENGRDKLVREIRGRYDASAARDVEFPDDATLVVVRRLTNPT